MLTPDCIKPWTCGRAEIRVLPPEVTTKKRQRGLDAMKEIALEGMTNTPYVRVNWMNGECDAALLDTGAQWSLMNSSKLTEVERRNLKGGEGLSGRGVSGEQIDVLGEIWRSVDVDGVLFEDHRFIVVEKMICGIILGIDFWSRASAMEFDFNEKSITLNKSHQIQLYCHPNDATKGCKEKPNSDQNFQIRIKGREVIPGRSEKMICCISPGIREGGEYFVQPISGSDGLVSTPYGLICGTKNGIINLRVANLGDEEMVMEKGTTIAVAQKDMWVRSFKAKDTPKGHKRGKDDGINFDEMMGEKLDKYKKTHLRSILSGYEDVFYKGGVLPVVRMGIEHTIVEEEGKTPKVSKPRRLSRELEEEVKKHVEELHQMGVIRPSNSKWAAPIVCVRKTDGTLRMAIDYRALNSISHTATLHPIPLVDDLLDRLGKAKYFAVLDAKSGYHQLPLRTQDSEKTAFVVPWGHFEFAERTPFGLKGAGYSFQRMMSVVLGASNYTDALCYLDDILVWGENWDIFIKRLKRIFEKVRAAKLALSPKKCKVGVEEVSYLGCTIRSGMVKISEQRVAQLREIERPVNVKALRSALGAFSYVQRWIPGLAEISKPLYDALTDKPYARLEWTSKMDEAFQSIKQLIADSVSLMLPDMEKRFTLVTDCSQTAIGAMLAQRDPEEGKRLKPVAFYHHTLSKCEQVYSPTERELLAIVKGVKKFQVYLGKGFEMITDHHSLRWLESLDPENELGRRGRWLDFLQQFDMEIVPKKGRSPEMRIADYLSRVQLETDVTVAALIDSEGKEIVVEWAHILDEQNKCGAIQTVKKAIMDGTDLNPGGKDSGSWRKPSLSIDPMVKEIWRMKDRLIIDGQGLLKVKFNGGRVTEKFPFGSKVRTRIIIPEKCKKEIMGLVHSSATAAHMGMTRTWQRARNYFWWPGMKQDIDEYIAGCEECGKNKHVNNPNKAPAQETSIPGAPLIEIMVDFVGPFQVAQTHNFRYIQHIQDVFSRYIIFVPTVDSQATTAAEALRNRWVSLFGVPESIRSDRGKHFTAEVFEHLCKSLGVARKLGSPEHPESQAQVERQNQLVNQLRCLCENNVEEWPQMIANVQCSHNASTNATTGFSPAKLLLGQEFKLPEDLLVKNEEAIHETSLCEREEEHQEVLDVARERLQAKQAQRVEEDSTDPSAKKSTPYVEGDLVRYKLNDDRRNKLGGKMAPRYSEPYRITNVKKNGFTYVIIPVNPESRGREKIRHFDLLKTVKRCNSDDERIKPDHSRLDPIVEEEQTDLEDTAVERENQPSVCDEPVGRPRRIRKPPTHLQVDGRKKRYEEEFRKEEESNSDAECN